MKRKTENDKGVPYVILANVTRNTKPFEALWKAMRSCHILFQKRAKEKSSKRPNVVAGKQSMREVTGSSQSGPSRLTSKELQGQRAAIREFREGVLQVKEEQIRDPWVVSERQTPVPPQLALDPNLDSDPGTETPVVLVNAVPAMEKETAPPAMVAYSSPSPDKAVAGPPNPLPPDDFRAHQDFFKWVTTNLEVEEFKESVYSLFDILAAAAPSKMALPVHDGVLKLGMSTLRNKVEFIEVGFLEIGFVYSSVCVPTENAKCINSVECFHSTEARVNFRSVALWVAIPQFPQSPLPIGILG
ncbi:hypothetical protein UY3_17902 [Chelonia mydas]|uniref:Uncharacterized protein n=1 Tax=Chelonia mydas TaxID=8469 RepID=M7AIW4_CHEMY|nr:hypothetical protein UY3_17902 [Chelonia mydas]